MTPGLLASLAERDLAEVIRSAGPYKARRLAAAARRIAADGPDTFAKTITRAPAGQAMAYLTSLPGVGAQDRRLRAGLRRAIRPTLPVDTHLFRVTRRLGLTSHDGTLTATTRDAIVSAMLSYGPDLAPAHFLFLLLGRTTCTAGLPRCGDCFLRRLCPSARDASPVPTPLARHDMVIDIAVIASLPHLHDVAACGTIDMALTHLALRHPGYAAHHCRACRRGRHRHPRQQRL